MNTRLLLEKLPNIVCFAISSSFWVDFVPLKKKDWVIVLGKIGPQTSGASQVVSLLLLIKNEIMFEVGSVTYTFLRHTPNFKRVPCFMHVLVGCHPKNWENTFMDLV